jgi:hypothetical protein
MISIWVYLETKSALFLNITLFGILLLLMNVLISWVRSKGSMITRFKCRQKSSKIL